MLRHVDLCSGIGGFALGFEWAGLSRPVMFCDIEPWSRKILAKHWPDVPIEEDVKVLANEPERIPECSILTAGYPCQPFSQAGKRRGEEDNRHIWPYIREIVARKRPSWCVFENVYGHVSMGLDTVLSDLEADGYTARPFIVPACGVDAPHRRDRVWIIAHANSQGEPNITQHEQRLAERPDTMGNAEHDGSSAAEIGRSAIETGDHIPQGQKDAGKLERAGQPKNDGDVADTGGARLQGDVGKGKTGAQGASSRYVAECGFWKPEPSVGRVANGVPGRVDRLRGLGNAIVPQVAMQIGLTIKAVNDAV